MSGQVTQGDVERFAAFALAKAEALLARDGRVDPLTWIGVAREELGPEFSDDDLDYILWQETGFPCYWPDRTKTPEENCRVQLRAFKAKRTAVDTSS